MTEEEKKAILYLNKYIDTDLTYESQHYSYIRMLIRLVGKQQKEIERLKEHNEELAKFILNSGLEIIKSDKKDMIIDKDKFAKFKIE